MIAVQRLALQSRVTLWLARRPREPIGAARCAGPKVVQSNDKRFCTT